MKGQEDSLEIDSYSSMCFLCYMSIVNWSGVVKKSLNILYLQYFLILFWVLGLFKSALFCWKEFLNYFSSWLLHHFNIIYVCPLYIWDAFDLGCGSFFAVLFFILTKIVAWDLFWQREHKDREIHEKGLDKL